MKRLWTSLLIKLHILRDWQKDSRYNPPAWPAAPHVYDNEVNGRVLTCCAQCGGGRKHAIHLNPWPGWESGGASPRPMPRNPVGYIEREH
jgi:hypothetical protein